MKLATILELYVSAPVILILINSNDERETSFSANVQSYLDDMKSDTCK